MDHKLGRATTILSKLAEVAHWIGAVSMVVGFVLLVVMGEKAIVPGSQAQGTVSAYGFEVEVASAAGALDMAALEAFMIVGAIILALMAMVFRNINLILKNSERASPFQPDNVRMVREIGYFLIAQPVVGFLGSMVVRLVATAAEVNTNVSLGSIIIALVVLSLSQIFAQGMALETDVDGLL